MSELEGKLVISSDHPERVVEDLGALSEAAGYRLAADPDLDLEDTYFDTAEERLRRGLRALRVREERARGKTTLRWAVKGPGEEYPGGTVERGEVEREWRPESLGELLEEIEGEITPGARDLDLVRGASGAPDPAALLAALGFHPIQSRRTLRRVRNVVDSRRPTVRLAELAIDSVRFSFEGREALHHELEVERKHPSGGSAVAQVLDDIRQRFPNALRPWSHPKLTLGQALLDLHRMGELPGLVDARGNLLPRAYDRISEMLEPMPA